MSGEKSSLIVGGLFVGLRLFKKGRHDVVPSVRLHRASGHAQFDMALDYGINFIGTAELSSIPLRSEIQGVTECIVGSWFKIRRQCDKFILASKVVDCRHYTWFRPGGEETRLISKKIRYALEGSLKCFGNDYIDLYQLH